MNNDHLNLKKKLIQIINQIDNLNWNKAKTIWLIDVCLLASRINSTNKTICTYGNEYEFIYRHIACLQSFNLEETFLSQNCSFKVKVGQKLRNYFYIIKQNDKYILNINSKKWCNICNNELRVQINFAEEIFWLFCEIDTGISLSVDLLPKSIQLGEKLYTLLCATFQSATFNVLKNILKLFF